MLDDLFSPDDFSKIEKVSTSRIPVQRKEPSEIHKEESIYMGLKDLSSCNLPNDQAVDDHPDISDIPSFHNSNNSLDSSRDVKVLTKEKKK